MIFRVVLAFLFACGIFLFMILIRFFPLLLIFSACLGRFSRPPRDTVKAELVDTLPSSVRRIHVDDSSLLVEAGRWLLMRDRRGRFLKRMGGVIVSAAAVAGYVIVVEERGFFTVFRRSSAGLSRVVRLPLPEPVPVPVFVSEGKFLFCGNRGGVYRISAPFWKPELIWRAKKGVAARPWRRGETLIVASFSKECVFLDPFTLSPVKKMLLAAVPDSTPVRLKENLYFATRGLRLLCSGIVRGEVCSQKKVRSWANRVTLLDGRPLYRTWHGDLVCVERKTLKDYWRYRTEVRLTLPLVQGYRLFVGGEDGICRILYRPNGREIGRISLGGVFVQRPVLFRKMVLAASGKRVFWVRPTRVLKPMY